MKGSAIVVVLLLSGTVTAQSDDKILGKAPAEWLTMLREHKELRYRRASLIPIETMGAKARGVMPVLLGALHNDPEPILRREAALLLGRMGPDADGAAGALAQSLRKDPDATVREAAATALGGKLAEQAVEFVADLAAALKDTHHGTRAAAAETLKNLPGDAARPAVPALLFLARDRKEERFPRIFAVQVVSRQGRDNPETPVVLAEILADKDASPSLRSAAAEGLGTMGRPSEAALTVLGQTLHDKSPELRRAVAAAFATLGAQARDAWPAVQAGLKDRDNAVRYQLLRAAGSIAKENPDAVRQLAELAQKEESVENRLAAVQELAALGPLAAPAVPTLTQVATGDVRASVREAAEAALKKIRPE